MCLEEAPARTGKKRGGATVYMWLYSWTLTNGNLEGSGRRSACTAAPPSSPKEVTLPLWPSLAIASISPPSLSWNPSSNACSFPQKNSMMLRYCQRKTSVKEDSVHCSQDYGVSPEQPISKCKMRIPGFQTQSDSVHSFLPLKIKLWERMIFFLYVGHFLLRF